jgi:hypothetical protein
MELEEYATVPYQLGQIQKGGNAMADNTGLIDLAGQRLAEAEDRLELAGDAETANDTVMVKAWLGWAKDQAGQALEYLQQAGMPSGERAEKIARRASGIMALEVTQCMGVPSIVTPKPRETAALAL